MVSDPGLITLSNEKVKLAPYKPRPIVERPMLSDDELIANKGGTLISDTEVYPNYFLISFKCHKTKKYFTLEPPFNERKLSWIMHNYQIVGFNWIKYDSPMVWLSYKIQDIPTLQRLSNALIQQGMWYQEAQKEFGFKIYDTNILDLIEVAPLKGSLKLYMARLHAKRLQELPFPPNQSLTDEQKIITKHYNFNDLDGTELLFDFMKERIELRRAMSSEYGLDLMSKSDAQIAEAVLVQEVTKLNGVRPRKPDIPPGFSFKYYPPDYIKYQTPALQQLLETVKSATFIIGESGKVTLPDELKNSVKVGAGEYRLGNGGLHSSEENVAYKATDNVGISDKDVTGYYPRLTTTLGLYPHSMGPAFLIAYDKIIVSRENAKKAARKTEANGKKIVVNGAGGKYSDPYSVLYDPPLTIQQNVTGQLALLLYIETVTLAGLTVISANTDGIVCLVPKSLEAKYQECGQYWQTVTGFNLEETRYSSYYARDVNSYFAVKIDAKELKDIKVKGPYSEIGSQSGTQLDTNPTTQICTDAVKQLLLDGTPVEKTIKNCQDFTRFITVRQAKAPGAHKNGEYAGKVLRWYYQKGEMGTINTVAANNKIPDSEGACLVLDLPNQIPFDLDYEWYERKATEILYEIAYYQHPKQQRLF
jgi:hypothetical protein